MSRVSRVLGVQRSLNDVLGGTANSNYQVGKDIAILLDEVLNNDISAIFLYDSFQNFNDEDLLSLTTVLRRNTSVVAITMSGIDIGDDVFSAMCDALEHTRVQYICITNMALEAEAGAALVVLAERNTNIRTVMIENTLIEEDFLDSIDAACQANELDNAPEMPIRRPQGDPTKRLCVPFQFNMCPNGDNCPFLHSTSMVSDARVRPIIRDWGKYLQEMEESTSTRRGKASVDVEKKKGSKTFTLRKEKLMAKENEGPEGAVWIPVAIALSGLVVAFTAGYALSFAISKRHK